MSRPKNKYERTQITTNFRKDLLKRIDMLAIELDTNRNIILEQCYLYCQEKTNLKEITNLMEV